MFCQLQAFEETSDCSKIRVKGKSCFHAYFPFSAALPEEEKKLLHLKVNPSQLFYSSACTVSNTFSHRTVSLEMQSVMPRTSTWRHCCPRSLSTSHHPAELCYWGCHRTTGGQWPITDAVLSKATHFLPFQCSMKLNFFLNKVDGLSWTLQKQRAKKHVLNGDHWSHLCLLTNLEKLQFNLEKNKELIHQEEAVWKQVNSSLSQKLPIGRSGGERHKYIGKELKGSLWNTHSPVEPGS